MFYLDGARRVDSAYQRLAFCSYRRKKTCRMEPTLPQLPTPKRPRVGKARGGRKEIPDAEKRTERIVLHVTKATYAKLKDMAKASGRPLAVVVRSLTRPQRKGADTGAIWAAAAAGGHGDQPKSTGQARAPRRVRRSGPPGDAGRRAAQRVARYVHRHGGRR